MSRDEMIVVDQNEAKKSAKYSSYGLAIAIVGLLVALILPQFTSTTLKDEQFKVLVKVIESKK